MPIVKAYFIKRQIYLLLLDHEPAYTPSPSFPLKHGVGQNIAKYA